MSQLIDLEELVDTIVAATILNVKPDTMHQWRWLGRGPKYLRLGSGKRAHIRYRRSDLKAWLDERQFQNTSQYSVDNSGRKISPPWERDAAAGSPWPSPADKPQNLPSSDGKA